jgi:hypothetical protein
VRRFRLRLCWTLLSRRSSNALPVQVFGSDIVKRMNLHTPLCLFLISALLACSTTDQNKVNTAVTTPLTDLNLVNAPVPEALVAAQRAPYAMPANSDCKALASEIKTLDEVLGADLDAPQSEANRSLLERGSDLTSAAAVGALQRTAEGVIPLRGWVRKLSGAEQYSTRVAAAITAGGIRRAFLKGMHASKGCS